MSAFSSSSSSSSRRSKRRSRGGKSSNLLAQDGVMLSGKTLTSRVFNPIGRPMSFQRRVPAASTVYRMVTTFLLQTVFSSSAAGEVNYALAFPLNLMNASELVNLQGLFDQFCIEWIECMLVPQIANVQGSTTNFGTLVTATDFDSDATNTVANLITFQNAKSSSGCDAHYRCWKPCVSLGVGATGLVGANVVNLASVTSPWLDLATSTTKHYGFKASISQTGAGSTQGYDLHVRYHLAFRNKI